MSVFTATTTSQKPLRYMTREEVAELIKSDKLLEKDYILVDVRDGDYTGGKLVGSLNRPACKFMLTVHDLVQTTKGIPLVIFHCALSQVRGPKAARIYDETRHNLFPEETPSYEVAVLRNGFNEFLAKYKDDPALVER